MEIDTVSYMKFLAALIFVLGLIGGFALVAKRMGMGNRGPIRRGKGKRLSIIETMPLDAKRRIILIRRDDKEHLLVIGASSEQVIETDIAIRNHEGDENIEPLPPKQPFLRALQANTNLTGAKG